MTEKEIELKKKQKELRNIYTSKIPIAILFVFVFSFIFPYLPRKSGRPPMVKVMDYSTAVILSSILLFTILIISYYWIISKKKKEIEKIKREVHVEKKRHQKVQLYFKF